MTTRPYHQAIPDNILELSHERDLLRRRGQYARADILKQQLEDAGYVVKDNPHGAHLVILPSVEVDGHMYRTARQIPSLLNEEDQCTFSVIVLARDNTEQTRRCVESVLRFAGESTIEVMLIDNASQDGLDLWAEARKHDEARLHLLRATRMMGVAEAYNLGLKQSRGRYILLLDASLELMGNIFTPLEKTLEDKNIGITGLHGLRTDDLCHFEESEELAVEAIDSQCMAFRRQWLTRAGMLDERYRFASYMDIDFNFAIREQGAQSVVTPDLPLIKYNDTQDANLSDAERTRLTKRNFYRFLEKWGNRDDLLLEEE